MLLMFTFVTFAEKSIFQVKNLTFKQFVEWATLFEKNNDKMGRKSLYLEKISIFSLLRILLVLTIFNLIVYFGTTQIFLARERYDVEQGAEVVRDFCLKKVH